MSRLLRDRSPFAKTVVVLAIALGIGLGLCGLSLVLPSSDQEFQTNWLSLPSLLVIVLSFFGLAGTLIAWMIVRVTQRGSGPQRLFETDDDRGDGR